MRKWPGEVHFKGEQQNIGGMKVRLGVMEKEVLSGIATGGQSIRDSMGRINNFKV